MPKAKNRLHATRVDRIAIVDKPAVPDAEIVIFKRHVEGVNESIIEKLQEINLDKDFNTGYVFRATCAAVDQLQSEVWNALYDEGKESEKLIKKSFADFTATVMELLSKVSITKDAGNKLTEKDITKPFARGLEIVAMSEAFGYFRNNLAYLVTDKASLENPEKILKTLIGIFQDFITKSTTTIVANKQAGNSEPVFEKEGRIISAARLEKLKAMMSVLSDIVSEVEERYQEKSIKEENNMELKEVIEKLEKVSSTLEALAPRLTLIEGALKEKGFLLTETEKSAYDLKEKKLVLSKRAKELGISEDSNEEAITKKEKEIEEKSHLEKRAVAVGLAKEASKEDIEKKEKEAKDAIEKKQKEEKENLEKRAEALGLAKDSTLEAVEKKEKENADARIGKIEKAVTECVKFIEVIGKRFGVKTSIDVDLEKSNTGENDPFASAVKGKSK